MRFSNKLVQQLRAWGVSKNGGSTTHYSMSGRKLVREDHWNESAPGRSLGRYEHSSLYRTAFSGKAVGKKTLNHKRVKRLKKSNRKETRDTRWWRPDSYEFSPLPASAESTTETAVQEDIPDDVSDKFEENVFEEYLENNLLFEPVVMIERKPFQDALKKVKAIPADDTLLVIYSGGGHIVWNLREFLLEKMEGATILAPGNNFPRRLEFKKIVFPSFSYHGDKRKLYDDSYNRWALATDYFLCYDRDLRNEFVDALIRTWLQDTRPAWKRQLNLLDPTVWTFVGTVPEFSRADWP